jgi:hypothetical protein
LPEPFDKAIEEGVCKGYAEEGGRAAPVPRPQVKVSQEFIGANTDAPRDEAFPFMIVVPSSNNNRDCRIVHYRSVYIVMAVGQGPGCYQALQGVRKGIA